MTAEIIKFEKYSNRTSTKTRRRAGKSFYQIYRLPIFNHRKRCAWNVKPSGDYAKDCRKGHALGLRFLETCDGSLGWASVMGPIIGDMIRRGPSGYRKDGTPQIDGMVIGFALAIGEALCDRARMRVALGRGMDDPGGPSLA